VPTTSAANRFVPGSRDCGCRGTRAGWPASACRCAMVVDRGGEIGFLLDSLIGPRGLLPTSSPKSSGRSWPRSRSSDSSSRNSAAWGELAPGVQLLDRGQGGGDQIIVEHARAAPRPAPRGCSRRAGVYDRVRGQEHGATSAIDDCASAQGACVPIERYTTSSGRPRCRSVGHTGIVRGRRSAPCCRRRRAWVMLMLVCRFKVTESRRKRWWTVQPQ
jgi:hypothetical protein